MRIVCVVMHFILLGIQIIGFKIFYKTNKRKYFIISFIGAYTLHFAWNSFLGDLVSLFIIKLL